MNLLSIICFILAGLIHLFIFALESLLWGKPFANKVFRLDELAAEQQKLFAFNQGFYNLFLALELFLGIFLVCSERATSAGIALSTFSAISMLAAAVVLLISAPHLKRAFIIQGLLPFIGLTSLAISFFK